MVGKAARRAKEVVLYLHGNRVAAESLQGLWNGCLVVAFGGWRRGGKQFFYVVHLATCCLLALLVFCSCCKSSYRGGEIDPLQSICNSKESVLFCIRCKSFFVVKFARMIYNH